MFSMDKYLIEAVKENWMSMWVLLTLAKAVALTTPSCVDNRIITLLTNLFKGIRKRKMIDEENIDEES